MQEIGLDPVELHRHELPGIRPRESSCPATIAAAGLNERLGITMSPIDLSTTYLGLPLAIPFIAGASPLSDHLDTVRRLEDGGCGAIVLHSLFEEQIDGQCWFVSEGRAWRVLGIEDKMLFLNSFGEERQIALEPASKWTKYCELHAAALEAVRENGPRGHA
jgi:hypothetical protein